MKKYSIKKLFCVMLSGTFLVFAGCNKPKPENTLVPPSVPDVEDGVHDFEVGLTEYDLVKDGATDYVIVVPEDAGEIIEFAAGELQYFLGEATGASFAVETDAGKSYSAVSKYLSLGNTSLAESAGVAAAEAEYTVSGYRIDTEGRSVFMVGGGDYGSLYAVYEFLRHSVGWEIYAQDEIVYQRAQSLKLPDFRVKDVPDIALRVGNYGVFEFDSSYTYRMRMMNKTEIWLPVGPNNSLWHNSFDYVDESLIDEHPDWFSGDGRQLCYSNDEMRLYLTEQLKKELLEHPEYDNVTITQEDANTWCTCEDCAASYEKYGTDSAVMIKFANEVSRDIKAWLKDEQHSDRIVRICFFAYHKTEQAPAKLNADGEYEPIDDSVVCDEYVNVFYAPIFADYNESAYSAENTALYNTMKAWTCITDKYYLWTYSTNFYHYLAFFNSFESMQSVYRLAKECNAYYIYDQGQFNNGASTGFSVLKNYLNAKLQWNVNADMEELTDDWFANYFKGAAEPMRELYDQIRTWYAYLAENTNMAHSVYAEIEKREYFPSGLLRSWQKLVDEAYAAVEGLKETDEAAYDTVCDRICLESIFVRYMDLQLYANTYPQSERLALMNEFKDDAERLGITNFSEQGSLSELWSSWNI